MKEYGLVRAEDGTDMVMVVEFEAGEEYGEVVFEGHSDIECLKWIEEQVPGHEAYIKGPGKKETIH